MLWLLRLHQHSTTLATSGAMLMLGSDLRAHARRQMLSDDPVTEPKELAQAGG